VDNGRKFTRSSSNNGGVANNKKQQATFIPSLPNGSLLDEAAH
jgi:hypothetical protein